MGKADDEGNVTGGESDGRGLVYGPDGTSGAHARDADAGKIVDRLPHTAKK
jgi:hypothetical protein